MRGACADVKMYQNQQIPMPYVHLLELLVTVYIFVAPVALVCKLLWVAPVVSGFFTLFFYGFFVLGTKILLDPFESEFEEGGFDTAGLFTSTVKSVETILESVPIGDRSGERLSKQPSAGPLHRGVPRSPPKTAGVGVALASVDSQPLATRSQGKETSPPRDDQGQKPLASAYKMRKSQSTDINALSTPGLRKRAGSRV